MIQLDIGCGRKPHKGFKTIDVEAYAKPDYLGDFREMTFENVDTIRAHHILEHFSRDEGVQVLNQWHSWLKVGGTLIVETPDVEGVAKALSVEKNEDRKYWLVRHLYGSQEADWAFHRDGWYESKFKGIMKEVGFEIEGVKKDCSRGYLPNITIVAKKK